MTARPKTTVKHVVARVDEIPDGGRLIVTVSGKSIGVFHVGGRFFALLNRCPHQAAPLCEGDIRRSIDPGPPGILSFASDRYIVICPWHAWEFDLETGQSSFDPFGVRVRRYPVDVEDGGSISYLASRETAADYSIEIFPVAIEDDYIVVSIG
jgi:3-phenylpropionate/trans-cinnamate dioxygenase ferredoxin subunit